MRNGLLLLALACLPTASEAAELYVSPAGNDAWSGTVARPNGGGTDGPFATLERARDAVRAMAAKGLPQGGVTVELAGGEYTLNQPLVLGQEDSGTADAPIIYRAAAEARVTLSGGQTIDPGHFRKVTEQAVLRQVDEAVRSNLVQLDLKAEGIDYLTDWPDIFSGFSGNHPLLCELFINGDRMQLARWPNEGFAHWDEMVDSGGGLREPTVPKHPPTFSYTMDRPARWNVDEGVWLWGYWARAYVCEAVKVGRIDLEKKQLTLAAPTPYGLDTWGAKRFFALNVLAELDAPGEWYLDRKHGLLYLSPPAELSQSRIVISRLTDPMIQFNGAQYVTLRGVELAYGRGDAVSMKNGEHNRVVGCVIDHVGRHGVEVQGGVDDGIVGCDIHHVGHAGIILNGGDRKTLTPAGHFAENNHIHHTSRIRRTHAGCITLGGVGNRASHNLMHHEPHSAVWYRGNDHLMEFNEIYWCHTETSEGGVFYTGRDWTYRDNAIRYNYIHHINDSLEGSPTGVNVVHLDDCVAGTQFIGNLCYRVGRGVSLCGGPDNIVENNIFVDTKVGVDVQDRGLQWWKWERQPDGSVKVHDTRSGKEGCVLVTYLNRVPYQSEPWRKYPHLADILDRDPVGAPWFCRVQRNLGFGGRLMTVSSRIKPEWVTIKDNWEVEQDPGFVDAAHGDFRLKPDAEALKHGFQQSPLDQVGLVNDGTRASWPVKPEPAPEGWRPRWMIQAEEERKSPAGLPVLEVKHVVGPITVDGTLGGQEWDPGLAAGVGVEDFPPVALPYSYDGSKSPSPSTARLATDARNLYVSFTNPVDPNVGVSGGHRWGQDDAVEIAIAVVQGKELGDIMLWRGYTDGHFETSNEAGAAQATVARVLGGVKYACQVDGKQGWTCEWQLPFSAMGIDPAKDNPKLLFNLSVRKTAGNLWVMWKPKTGSTWAVRESGFLWLSEFGNVSFGGNVPSQARIDVTGKLTLAAVKGCEVATWSKPVGQRLTGSTGDLPTDRWVDFEYAFTPAESGEVMLNLMGRQQLTAVDNQWVPVWVFWDHFRVEGAKLVNGSFEQLDAKGQPVGWQRSLDQPFVVTDAVAAADGQRFVKTWHNGRYTQTLKVTAGQTVTIKVKVRGE